MKMNKLFYEKLDECLEMAIKEARIQEELGKRAKVVMIPTVITLSDDDRISSMMSENSSLMCEYNKEVDIENMKKLMEAYK